MNGICSLSGGDEKLVQNFSEKNLQERDHVIDQGLHGKIMLKFILNK
jgi:hypothetical protein